MESEAHNHEYPDEYYWMGRLVGMGATGDWNGGQSHANPSGVAESLGHGITPF